MTIVCWLDKEAGAVYKPPWLKLPSAGLTVQFTPLLLEFPLTAAVNCRDCAAAKVVAGGLIDTVIGWAAGAPGFRNAMVVTAKLGFAMLLAVMLTIAKDVIVAGAV